MSRIIDEQVVQMRFDNDQFVRGVSESVSSLNRLRKNLDFDGASKSLKNLTKESSSLSSEINSTDSILTTITRNFSALEIAGITAISRLTNKIIDLGYSISNALLFEPVSTGMDEYELKMDNIQTTLVNSGESLEKVTDTLDSMNVYADKTIYKFMDMTTALGKFTIAGISLDEAADAIKGIGNAAAMSGLKASQASSAYYMISQAYQSGVMRLYQFRTLENSGFASREFRQHLLDAGVAMGTLKKTADGLYKTTAKDSEVTIENMRDTLDELWVTKDVLNKVFLEYSDETTAFGKKAYDAAQKIKTASQLWDTLAEAAQSGWAKNWEYIIGDYYQAMEVWGRINEIVGGALNRLSDSQAAALKYWNQSKEWDETLKTNMSGRDYAIKALSNAFWSLMLAIKPIQEAFSEIFPKLDGKRLTDFSKTLYKLSMNFAISLKNAENLKQTFKGFFAVLGILKELIFQIGQFVIDKIIPKISWIPELILSITASIGKFLSKLYEFIDTNNSFYYILNNLGGIFKNIAVNAYLMAKRIIEASSNYSGLERIGYILKEVIFTALESISNVLNDHFGIDFSEGISKIENSLSKVGQFLKGVKNYIFDLIPGLKEMFSTMSGDWAGLTAAEKLSRIISGIGNGVFIIASSVIDLVTTVTGNIVKALREIKLTEIVDFVISGALTTGVASVVAQISDLIDPLGDFGQMLNNVREDLMLWGNSIKIDMVSKFAIALGIFAAALFLLSKVNASGMIAGFVAIAALMKTLVTVSNVMLTLTGDLVLASAALPTLIFLGSALIKISISVAILAGAIAKLGKLNFNQILKGLFAVVMTLGALFLVAKEFSKLSLPDGLTKITGKGSLFDIFRKSNISQIASAILKLSFAISVLTVPILILGKMDLSNLTQGVLAVGALFLVFSAFAKITNGLDLKVTASSLSTFAVAVLIMTVSLGKLAKINDEPILDAALALGGMFAVFYLFTKLTKGFDLAVTAKALLTFSFSMLIMSSAIKSLSKATGPAILDGVMAISALIAVFGMFVMLTKGMDAVSTAAGLAIFSVSVGIMAASLTVLSLAGASAYSAAQSIAVLIAVFGALSFFTSGAKMLGLAAGLTVFGVAVGILAADLMALSLISTGSMIKSIIFMAGIIAGLAVASNLLLAAAPGIAAFGAALIPFGAACALVSGSLLMAAAAVYVLVAAVKNAVSIVTDSAESLVTGVATVISLVGAPQFNETGEQMGASFVEGFGKAFTNFALWDVLGGLIKFTAGFVKNTVSEALDFISGVAGWNTPEPIEALRERARSMAYDTSRYIDPDYDPNAEYIEALKELGVYDPDKDFAGVRQFSQQDAMKERERLDAKKSKVKSQENKASEYASSLGETFTDLWDFVSGKDTDTAKFEQTTDKLMTILGDVKDEFTARYGLNDALDSAKDSAKDLANELSDELSGALGNLDSGATEAKMSLEDITKTIQQQISIFDQFERPSEKTIEEYLSNMSSNALGVFDWASNISRLAMRGMSEDLLAEIVNKGPDAWNIVSAFATGTDEQIAQANKYYQTVRDSMSLAANQVKSSLDYSAQMTANGYSEALKNYIFAVDATGITNSSMDDVVASIQFNSDRLAEEARLAAEKAEKAALEETGKSSYKVGENIVEGIKKGVLGKSGSLTNTMVGVSKKLVNTAMYVLDEHSPSKVFEKIGRFLMEGAEIGITESANKPINAVQLMGEGTIAALNNVMNDVDAATSFQPTITPIIDLSNVQNGVNSIDSLLSQKEAIMASINYQANVQASYEEARQLQLNAIETSVNRIGESIVNAIISSSNNGVDVRVSLSPDSTNLFKMVRAESTKFKRANGYNAFS